MEIKITDFVGKGSSLLFSFPLYTKIKFDLEVESRDEIEVLDDNEEFGPTILNHTEYIEGMDFRFLKTIFLKEHNIYSYCPECKRDNYIVSNGLEAILDNDTDDILTIGTNISSAEENEAHEQYALEKLQSRAKEFFEKVFGETNTIQLKFHCTSKHKHKMYVIFHLTEDGYLIKTGQYPSIMDFEKFKNLDEIFGKDNVSKKDFRTATILKTHNYGVAAFLYLRRIFERLIILKAQTAISEGLLREEDFEKKKMQEKVKQLHELGKIPDYLNENKTFIYGILSKGLHQLTEKDCLANYEPLKEAILIILKENSDLEKREKIKKETSKKLNSIHTEMKSK
ncbi:hypothetical protein [Niallia sp. RD1]|uniref:hypothetical protein n=1 Tax=Niallia sp. RD1 TaxID=2962858 RepID=UPI0020C19BA9|nr:hypothetical protein [Niallia sp. RD1]UTI43256.1 hypothetical protein NKG37_05925 [Niallia sp. RD1]